jgi:hypothetical protein
MRKVRNITVSVDPELYRQTRRLAAENDTTVTEIVRFLLLVMPEALKAARFPGGRPQFGIAAARAASATPAAPISPPPAASPATAQATPFSAPTPSSLLPEQIEKNLQNRPVPL